MNCIVAGASGLIGGHLIFDLINNTGISSIFAITRAPLNLQHSKLKTITTSFEDLKNTKFPKAEIGFCCLGTTIKKAKSRDVFYKVDHDYIINFAQNCLEAGTSTFVVVSALGANEHSKIFYNKVKGQTERDLIKMGFKHLIILRPSLLLGARSESRPMEKLAQTLSLYFKHAMIGPLAKSRPIEAKNVAHRMLSEALNVTNGSAAIKIILNHQI